MGRYYDGDIEGLLEFCEGDWYTIKALLPKESEVE